MDKYKILACIGGAIGLCGVIYAVGTSIKLNKLCKTIDRSIDDLADETTIDIPEAMVEQAVKKSVDREVGYAVDRATAKIVNDIKIDIHRQIKTAVDISYSELKESISNDMSRQAANIDIQELKDEVVAKAEEKIIDKFDDELDSVLDKFNRELENVGKIYKSIANKMSESN